MEKQFKIFLATDYSEGVRCAEHYAIQFAESTNAFITIAHVYDVPFSFPSEPSQYAIATDKLRKSELLRLKQHFNDLLKSLDSKLTSKNFECIVLEGAVGKQIRKEAEHAHMDLIITGTHENDGFRKFLLGNHTWDIIKKSEVPVLAIPQNALMRKIKSIVFATEFRKGEIPGINFLVKIAELFGAQLTILHIAKEDDLSKEAAEKAELEKFLNEIQEKVPYDKLNLLLVHYDDVVEGLTDFCSTTKNDWLVVSHAKPALGNMFNIAKSVTKEMTFQTQIPLLTIPDFYVPVSEN